MDSGVEALEQLHNDMRWLAAHIVLDEDDGAVSANTYIQLLRQCCKKNARTNIQLVHTFVG